MCYSYHSRLETLTHRKRRRNPHEQIKQQQQQKTAATSSIQVYALQVFGFHVQ